MMTVINGVLIGLSISCLDVSPLSHFRRTRLKSVTVSARDARSSWTHFRISQNDRLPNLHHLRKFVFRHTLPCSVAQAFTQRAVACEQVNRFCERGRIFDWNNQASLAVFHQ